MKHSFSYYYGCLIGGAIGDALGAPIEMMRFEQVMGVWGKQGITGYIIPPGHKHALITDDTQLMMFTTEGLIRSATRAHRKNKERTLEGISIAVHRAYLRWLYTQGLHTERWSSKDYDGWLVNVARLHAYREPGVTCLTSLGKGFRGTLEQPISDSLGCGCVMRVAPVGLIEEEERVFDIAIRLAAITHGHPTAYLSGGALAYMIHQLVEGKNMQEAAYLTREKIQQQPNHEALLEKIDLAIALAKEEKPSRDTIEQIGKGFDAHEVLARAMYAALAYPEDYLKAVLLGVNHSGDSDSVGGITGCLMGCSLGYEKIPEELISEVELHREIKELAEDLCTFYKEGEEWLKKYPAW